MPFRTTHKQFLEKLRAKNSEYANGDFKVISPYVCKREPIELLYKDGSTCRVQPESLLAGNYTGATRKHQLPEEGYHKALLDRKLSEGADPLRVVGADFKEMYQTATGSDITYTQYFNVVRHLMMKIWENVVKKNWIFKAPSKFGEFYVKETLGTPGKISKYIHWPSSRKLGKIVHKRNLHTNGRSFRVEWSTMLSKTPSLSHYKYDPAHNSDAGYGTDLLCRWIRECSEDPYTPDYRGQAF